MTLKSKFKLIVWIAAAALAALSATWLSSERSRILAEKEQTAMGLAEAACSVVADQQKMESEGKLSREEA